jgi:hypothetical protein
MFIKHTSCDLCGSSDARALYRGGSWFCFSCRRYGGVGVSPYLLEPELDKELKVLPDDANTEYGTEALQWISQYDISVEELLKRGILWSSKRRQLIYTWRDGEGRLTLWQARNFHPDAKKKCYTAGDTEHVLPIYQNVLPPLLPKLHRLVIVEDPVSAMKIARCSDAMPCLGNDLPPAKLKRLAGLYGAFLVWLDRDMLPNSHKIARRLQMLGCKAHVHFSEHDPKYYDDGYIKEILDKHVKM